MALIKSIVVLFAVICLSKGSPTGGSRYGTDIIWFPDPSTTDENKFIPAYMNWTAHNPDEPPAPADLSKIHFLLYTKQNPNTPDEIFINDVDSYRRSRFQAGAKLKLMSHGFGGDVDNAFPWQTKNQFLTFNDNVERNNIILIGWPQLAASPDYISAAANCKVVAEATADFINFILQQGETALEDVHVIGFSLGGQVAGITGHRFTQRTGRKLPRVTGLDPALPLFDSADDRDRISDDDADFVDIIHSSAGFLGIVNAKGTVDFFPNGGSSQPGCGVDPVGSCAHSRGPAYFKESLDSVRGFQSCECADWDQYNGGNCACSQKATMGYWVDKRAKGKFYLRTNSAIPYAQG